MQTGPAAFPTIGGFLLDAVQARFASHGVPRLERAAVVPAPIVWDDCHCGLLAVAVTRISPSVDGRVGADAGDIGIPAPTPAMPWPPFLLTDVQVAVLRCATVEGDPSAEVLAAEGVQVHTDAYWTLVAVTCELDRLRRAGEIEDYVLRDQPFLPAAGGCQGSLLNAAVSVPFKCPCD
jgi:hypothetical protein